jgi:DNA-binding NtrC family response regulator
LRYQMPEAPLTVEDQQVLLSYDWPGNVRELRSCADRIVLGLPLMVGSKNQPAAHRSLEEAVAMVERSLIEESLRRHGGSVKDACTDLCVTSATMYRKMKTLGVDATEYRLNGTES